MDEFKRQNRAVDWGRKARKAARGKARAGLKRNRLQVPITPGPVYVIDHACGESPECMRDCSKCAHERRHAGHVTGCRCWTCQSTPSAE